MDNFEYFKTLKEARSFIGGHGIMSSKGVISGRVLKAPFPYYFGGKSTVADVIWAALGQPKHYIEPFFGSGAVLLSRPDYNPQKHMETVCDKDGHVANAWRGMQFAPDELAKFCDWPVNHADLNARRKYLNDNAGLLLRLCDDPEYFDAKMAGYWIWAMSSWIGAGLTRPDSMPRVGDIGGVHKITLVEESAPALHVQDPYTPGQGVAQDLSRNRPQVALQGSVHALSKIPLPTHETGVGKRPCYGAKGARGVHKTTLTAEPDPLLDVRAPYTPGLYEWFRQLSERLRRVRVVCGEWNRVCGGDWQDDCGTCGIFFDPPYSDEAGRDKSIYHEESGTVAHEVREWCRKRADRKTYRIVLAGYFDEHSCLLDEGWTVHRWSARGGFANRGKGNTKGKINRHKEALFFSPHCHSSGLKRFETEDS
jgi:site-specific DNA-adenine methylase